MASTKEDLAERQEEHGFEHDPEEERSIEAVLDSFSSYRRAAHYNVTHLRRQNFYALPSAHWTLLAEPPFSVLSSLDAVDEAIDANADIAEAILANAGGFLNSEASLTDANGEPRWQNKASPTDLEKARSTLRQFYRDWSAEGAEERKKCYDPILEALAEEFSIVPESDRGRISVLVPGAGLGRLVFELCCAGYSVEGNEISYHQLMASSFILNSTKPGEQYPLYPWALSFSNHRTRADQLQKVMIPDVHPGTALAESSEGKSIHAYERMAMSASDFCVSHSDAEHREMYDAVATVFFIDTAPNLIRYIEAIHNCLAGGGVWINLGPLLWHFENNPPGSSQAGNSKERQDNRTSGAADMGIGEPGSVELTEDEVIALVERFGFTIMRLETGKIETGYIQDPGSMLQNIYKPSFWIAKKN